MNTCIVHQTRHFLMGKGFFAWCEKHGRLNRKGQPRKPHYFAATPDELDLTVNAHLNP